MSEMLTSSQSCQTLADWLCYIEQSHPIDKIELGLERVKRVADRAELALLPGKVILIAGTNGKGSTVTAVETIYRTQGYKTGSHMSPHLYSFNERICINGQPVSDDLICLAFTAISQEAQRVSL